MAVAVFNLTLFRARYPEFATLGDDIVTAIFSESTLYCNNTDNSVIADVNVRLTLLNMMTAHLLAINFGVNGQAPSSLVGKLSNVKEGSVSATVDYGSLSRNQQWFCQTKYGAAFWQASLPYRSALYVPPPSQPVVFVPRA